jgi:hypothetical protein
MLLFYINTHKHMYTKIICIKFFAPNFSAFFKFFQTSHISRNLWRPCKIVRSRELGSGVATMERRFSIEAKSFCFSTKDGSSMFRLEERRKKFVGYIFVSPQCSAWLIFFLIRLCLVDRHGGSSVSGEGEYRQVLP